MATYDVVYWQEIPVEVQARDGGLIHTEALSRRFQDLVDFVARRRGLDAADDYIRQWARGDKASRPGTAREVAVAVAAELEADYDAIKSRALAEASTRQGACETRMRGMPN